MLWGTTSLGHDVLGQDDGNLNCSCSQSRISLIFSTLPFVFARQLLNGLVLKAVLERFLGGFQTVVRWFLAGS